MLENAAIDITLALKDDEMHILLIEINSQSLDEMQVGYILQ